MIVTRTYKYKLYRNKKNTLLHQRIDVAGLIWNHCIALHRRYYRLTGKHVSQYDVMKHIAKLCKLPKYEHYNTVGSQARQDICQRIERAYKLFFRNLKAGIKTAPPKFQKVKKYRSFTLKQAGWKVLGGNRICIQGHVYTFSTSRELPDTIKTVTVKRDTLGNLYLYFAVQEDIDVPDRQGKISVGFDFGLKTFLVGSDGSDIVSPLYFSQSLDALRAAQRTLSSKRKGSNNWHKAQRRVARLHQRVVNQRRDWFFKLAHMLTDRYDYLFFEDLNMRGMVKLWGRKVSDLARSEFLSILGYVATCKGVVVHCVDRYFPSTKTCHGCGYVNKELTLLDRQWTCASCGAIHDRDHNAAKNIESEGASSLGLEGVRRASQAALA